MFVVGIDVGGAFTDVTAVDGASGRVVVTKVPSQPNNEAAAVLAGLDALGIDGRGVRRLVHGTTVGTNAILERRGARVALITTAGFRDLIEIGRTKRNIPVLFVPTFVRPKPFVERALTFEVDHPLLHHRPVLTPPAHPAPRRQARSRGRRARPTAARAPGRLPAPRLRQSRSRTRRRRARPRALSRGAGVALVRRRAGVSRVRAVLDHGTQRVFAAAD